MGWVGMGWVGMEVGWGGMELDGKGVACPEVELLMRHKDEVIVEERPAWRLPSCFAYQESS